MQAVQEALLHPYCGVESCRVLQADWAILGAHVSPPVPVVLVLVYAWVLTGELGYPKNDIVACNVGGIQGCC